MSTKLCPTFGHVRHVTDNTDPETQEPFHHVHPDPRPRGIKRIRVKCPTCGRRLMSSVRVCDDGCCVYHELPRHKPKGWWKKKKRGRTERREKRR